MKCILMNKNTEVFTVEYDSTLHVFTKIIKIHNIDYAPYSLKKLFDNGHEDELKAALSHWFKGRGIPSFRDHLDLLLAHLGVRAPEDLLDKAFGLSLTDQYWLKPKNENIKYQDINFFEHDFSYAPFLEISLSNTPSIVNEVSLKTPNNTTDGKLKKAWIIEDNIRYLLKGGSLIDGLEPFQEVLASIICRRLGINHVPYTIEIRDGKLLAKCPCFINSNTEFIPASQILEKEVKYSGIEDFNNYVKILTNHGITKTKEKVEAMFLVDFLLLNIDRHLGNFGIIRDVNSLKWLDVAPIFDTGSSYKITDLQEDTIIVSDEGRFFYEVLKFDDIIKLLPKLTKDDFKKLAGVVEEYRCLLEKYAPVVNLSERKIGLLCFLLERQINKLNEVNSNEE